MKQALALILALAFTSVSFAANTQPIEETFQRYWSSFVKKDFAKVTGEILPSDLEDLKKAVLPIFVGDTVEAGGIALDRSEGTYRVWVRKLEGGNAVEGIARIPVDG